MPTYKDQRTGRWYCKFVYEDWSGKKKQKKKMGFRLQKEAKEYEMDFIARHSKTCDMRFSLFVDVYIEDCKARLRPTTLSGKQYIINEHIIPYFGQMKLNEINAVTVRNWQTELLNHPSNYKETYLKTIHNQLSAIMNFACRFYGLRENPAKQCGTMGKKQAEGMQFWTLREFRLFEKTISDNMLSHTIFSLLFWSGMRSGELLALVPEDFNFDTQTIKISKNYARLNGRDLLLPPKTPKSNRQIALPLALCVILQQYINTLPKEGSKQRLFPVTKKWLSQELKRGIEASGVKMIRVHDLRHSHASLLVELGCSPILISERLGHEDIKTTLQTYSHLYPNKQKEVVNLMENWCENTLEN